MVKKTSKFEVHSGNSLKASNSKHIKLYCKQSFIVRQYDMDNSSEVTPKDLDKQLCDWDVGQNNITYSLNKKGRWELPGLLKEHIHSDEIGEDGVKVSLLEHHKKRRANCVSYHASKGEITTISPRKGYFDKSSINAKPGKPRTQRKRRRANGTAEPAESEEETDVAEPQIMYEVFYPCRKTSSIVHNPKYFCQLDFSDNGKAKRSANRRAKLTTTAYMDIFDEEKGFDETFEDVDVEQNVNADDASVTRTDDAISTFHPLEALLERALIAKDLCDVEKGYVFPKSAAQKGRMCWKECEVSDKKDCVVYLDEAFPAAYSRDKNSKPQYKHTKKRTPRGNQSNNVQTAPTELSVVPAHIKIMPSCRILLSSDAVTEAQLNKQFSDKYFEAQCNPRKFAIDITEQVTEILRRRKFIFSRQEAWSLLIFTSEGMCDNDLQVFRVHLNSELGIDQPVIETLFEMNMYSLEEVCQSTFMFVESCSLESVQELPTAMCATSPRPVLTFDLLSSLKGWERQTYHSSQSYKAALADSFQQMTEMEEGSLSYQNTTEFCTICFDELDCCQSTSLKSCGHWFCNSCWQEHFYATILRGTLNILCPEFNCKSVADHITALSVISASEYKKYLQHCHDYQVQMETDTKKWCPNPKCGRILKALNRGNLADRKEMCITCDCGTSICFTCLWEAHWPATCEQAKNHRKRVKELGDTDAYLWLNTDTSFVVEVKLCPKCHNPINKNGGCPHMMCRCGHTFCWLCLADWPHLTTCKNSGNSDSYGTVKRVLRHVDRLRDRPKFYLMSLTHRHYRQPKVLKAFRKKENTLKAILKEWGLHHLSDVEASLPVLGMKEGDVECLKDAVDNFVGQMANLNIELHFVMENTAVILQDSVVRGGAKMISQIIERMEFIANRIEQVFEDGGYQDLKTVVKRLQKLQRCARRCLIVLISCLADIQK